MQQEKKQKSSNKWSYFKKGCFTVFIVLIVITLKASFYFTGPLKVKVIDAKTDEPIENIEVVYNIRGKLKPCSAGGCGGWYDERHQGYTDNKGEFKIPISIVRKFPFRQELDHRSFKVNGSNYRNEDKNYEGYEHEFTWFPFRSFEFALVPIPETLDDCRDLTEKEQYRCVKPLARKDASRINKLSDNPIYDKYLASKYQHLLKGECDMQLNVDYSIGECRAVLAVIEKNKDICLNDDICIFFTAIDLKEKDWCGDIPEKKIITLYQRKIASI